MQLGIIDKYLIIINIVGFIAYFINMLLYKYTENGQIDALLNLISIAGGSAGIILFILLFDRKPDKEQMMSRVFVSAVFVIELIILLVLKGHISDSISFDVVSYFKDNHIFLYYLILINIIAFVVYAVDKANAADKRTRVRIITLLGLAFVGGSVGSLAAVYLLRHKTRKDYFTVGIPLIMVMQAVVLFYVMNIKI